MKKIIHITTVHSSSDTRILHKECKSLTKAGHVVILLASGIGASEAGDIQLINLPPSAGRLRRIVFAPWKAAKLVLKINPDLCHFHDPELIPLGIFLKLVGKKVVYDVHEDVPRQMLYKEYLHPFYRVVFGRLAALAEWVGSKFFDGIVAATPTIAARFPVQKTVTIQNFPISHEFPAVPDNYQSRPPHLAYVGSISRLRGIMEMLWALELLPKNRQIRLRLAGRFYPSELESQARGTPGFGHVDFLGVLSRPRVTSLLASVRLGLVLLHPSENYLVSYPVKLFEYMAAGIPVVASDFPLWREIVQEAGCGLLVDPTNPHAIAEAVLYLLDNPDIAEIMGRRGREAVLSRYTWDREAEKLLRLYKVLLE